MDFTSKGMVWVGSLRQKFETMCLEMEDLVCQEAKYVENQVQTVGVTVKKIYTEVVDLLPTASLDPSVQRVSDLSVVQNADTGKDKMSNEATNEDHIKGKSSQKESGVNAPSSVNPIRGAGSDISLEEETVIKRSKPATVEDPVKEEKHAPCLSEVVAPVGNQSSLMSSPDNVIPLDPVASGNPDKGTSSDLPMEENSDIQIYKKSRVNIEEDVINLKQPLPEASTLVTSWKDTSPTSFSNKLRRGDNEKASDCLTKKSPTASVEVTVFESSPESGTFCDNVLDAIECIADVSSSLQCSDSLLPVVPSENLEIGLPLYGSILPTESDELAVCNDDVESCMEKIELFDDVKLGESCIVVENKDLFFTTPSAGNHRSFKKKLQNALASRMRSKKQREYEQLAILYGDFDADFNQERAKTATSYTLTRDLELKLSTAHDLNDSDWELV